MKSDAINSEKLLVINQSATKNKINFKIKKKIITFVGKLNRSKGYDLFGKAVIKILKNYKDWSAYVIGDEPRDKLEFNHNRLIKLGFTLSATQGTCEILKQNGMKCKKINKVSGGSPHIVDVLNSKKIALVINTGGGKSEHRLQDAIALRRATLINKVPYCTNMSTAQVCIEGIRSLNLKEISVTSLQDIK